MTSEPLSVLQYLRDATDISEKCAKEIFYNYLPEIDGYQSIRIGDPFNLTEEHCAFVLEMINIYKNPDFYGYDETGNDTDIDTEIESDDENENFIIQDPFFYSKKLDTAEIKNYTKLVKCNYYCTICCTDKSGNDKESLPDLDLDLDLHLDLDLSCHDKCASGLQVSCSKNNSCTFCPDCIIPWLTENVAKCPNCAFVLK